MIAAPEASLAKSVQVEESEVGHGKSTEEKIEEFAEDLGRLLGSARAKAEGLVRAVGVSSHSREVLTRLVDLQAVDVALAVVNQTGSWMKDATPKEMTDAIKRLYRSGRGVCGINLSLLLRESISRRDTAKLPDRASINGVHARRPSPLEPATRAPLPT